MAGTKEGGARAAATNKRKYGKGFYADIGKLGGMARHPNKGFGGDIERAREAGKVSGRISRRNARKAVKV